MSKAITCVFTAPALGVTSASALATKMAAVPVDLQFTNGLGLSVISDNTGTTDVVPYSAQRTIVLGLGPGLGNPGHFNGSAASISAFVQGYLAGSAEPPGPAPIDHYTFSSEPPGGTGYIRPPYLQITDSEGGVGSGAVAYAQMTVNATVVTGSMTSPYTAATVVTATGGELAPGGSQATFSVTIDGGGNITGITVLTGGGPYNSPPTLTITDSGGGEGQGAVALLGISKVVPMYAGVDYTAPLVTVVPFFKVNWPDADPAAQIAAVQGFMQLQLEEALNCGVITSIPVVS
jgi:hypothetical protein